jgi:predicted RNase H-like HicB family nuclease
MKNFTVYIEKDEDGVFVGSVPSLPGCYSQGVTVDELLANMQEVAALCARNQDVADTAEFVGVQNLSVSVA